MVGREFDRGFVAALHYRQVTDIDPLESGAGAVGEQEKCGYHTSNGIDYLLPMRSVCKRDSFARFHRLRLLARDNLPVITSGFPRVHQPVIWNCSCLHITYDLNTYFWKAVVKAAAQRMAISQNTGQVKISPQSQSKAGPMNNR